MKLHWPTYLHNLKKAFLLEWIMNNLHDLNFLCLLISPLYLEYEFIHNFAPLWKLTCFFKEDMHRLKKSPKF